MLPLYPRPHPVFTAIREEELQAESLELKNRCADLDCRNADLDQREVGRMKLATRENIRSWVSLYMFT